MRELCTLPFDVSAVCRDSSSTQRDPCGHAVQPAWKGVTIANRPPTSNEHQECGLKSIVGVVGIGQNLSADSQDHWPMTLNQNLKGWFTQVRLYSQEAIH
jgi:hypothetical protein